MGLGRRELALEIGPLDSRANDLLGSASVDAFPAPEDAVQVLVALKIWMTNGASGHADGAGGAIAAFVLLLRDSAALSDLLKNRDAVCSFLGGPNMKLVPQPPIPNLPGLFFRVGRDLCAVILDTHSTSPADLLPSGFDWLPLKDAAESVFPRFTATLPPDAEVLSEIATRKQPSSQTVALLYRAFYDFLRKGVDGERTPLTSAYALIAQRGVRGVTAYNVSVLAWQVLPESVRDLSFPNRGESLGIERLLQSEGDWLWRLGRAFSDLFGAPYVFEASAEGGEEIPNRSRIGVALRRKVLAQLSGPRLLKPGFEVKLRAGELPPTLERGLRALKSSGGTDAVPTIWLHFLEGRLMAERMRHSPAFAETPGGAAHLLSGAGRRTILPRDDVEDLALEGMYDPKLGLGANAWSAVADAVVRLAERASSEDKGQLHLFALGVQLHAATLGFRDIALAILARMKVDDRDLVQLAVPDLAGWDFGADAVLVRPSYGVSDVTRDDFELKEQIAELFLTLHRVTTSERRMVVEQELWRITLLGWLVVVGVLTASLPTRFAKFEDERDARPALPRIPDAVDFFEVLGDLARRLLALGTGTMDPEPDWPWGLFASADIEVGRRCCDALASVVSGVDLSFGGPYRTSQLVTHDQGGAVRVRDDIFGELRLQPFQYVVAGLLGDVRRDLQVDIADDGEVFQVWSEIAPITEGGRSRPLIVSRLTASLAKRSGLGGRPQPPTADALVGAMTSDGVTKDARTLGLEPAKAAPIAHQELADTGEATLKPGLADRQNLDSLGRLQLETWTRRGNARSAGENSNAGRHMARIAFLQVDFADSYEDPKAIRVKHGSGHVEPSQTMLRLPNGAKVNLCPEEWRRRLVLNRVIEACEAFKVDILVLPEYSVRAETVLWLGRKLHETASTLSVWAGTFRVPSGFSIAVDVNKFIASHQSATAPDLTGRESWKRLQAIAPVIFRDRITSQGAVEGNSETSLHANVLRPRLCFRQKRYPAIAFHEVFYPSEFGSELKPLTEFSRSPWRPESYVFELICSEIFAFNGPININSIAANLADLMVKFGRALSLDDAHRKVREQIESDQKIFSDWVSHDFARENWPRRSILIAPCITRRDVDYHALGVTAHLSAGVATVFCNSIVSGYSNGGSCLIGFNGWETRRKDAGAIGGPYHGVVPGIFAPRIPGVRTAW